MIRSVHPSRAVLCLTRRPRPPSENLSIPMPSFLCVSQPRSFAIDAAYGCRCVLCPVLCDQWPWSSRDRRIAERLSTRMSSPQSLNSSERHACRYCCIDPTFIPLAIAPCSNRFGGCHPQIMSSQHDRYWRIELTRQTNNMIAAMAKNSGRKSVIPYIQRALLWNWRCGLGNPSRPCNT
jgi:hypothetical protein